MGAMCTSVQFVVQPDIPGQDKESFEIIKALKFSDVEINKLFAEFKKCDADNSNHIQLMELFHHYNAELTPFNRKIFSIFDDDGSGEINFLEFVCSNWNFLTLAKEEIGVIAYMMCDKTGVRPMELPELKDLVETIHGRSIDSIPVIKGCFDELFKSFTGRFQFREFVKWTAANPAILVPLHSLQVSIMNKLIGQEFWLRKQAERYSIPEMKEPRYIFQFQQKIVEIHERKKHSEAMQKLHEEINKVRGYSGSGRKDRKQDEIMDKFGLGEKKEQRRGVNMPGDLDLAIREGNEEILGGPLNKEEKKKPRATVVIKKSGKVNTEMHDLDGSNNTSKDTEISNTPAGSGTGPRESRKTVAVSNKEKSSSVKESVKASRKTVLPPIQQASAPPSTVPSTSSGEQAVPRRGRQTFVQK